MSDDDPFRLQLPHESSPVFEVDSGIDADEAAEGLAWVRAAFYVVLILLLVVCSPAIVVGVYRFGFFE